MLCGTKIPQQFREVIHFVEKGFIEICIPKRFFVGFCPSIMFQQLERFLYAAVDGPGVLNLPPHTDSTSMMLPW